MSHHRFAFLHAFTLLALVACGSDDDNGSSGSGGSGAGGGDAGTVPDGGGGTPSTGGGGGSGGVDEVDGGMADAAPEPFPPLPPLDYSGETNWACMPGIAGTPCLEEVTVVEMLPDGSTQPATITSADTPTVDCFYVYPTVDWTGAAGNRTDFENRPQINDTLVAHLMPFKGLCNQYAPLYRQITLPTYGDGRVSQGLDLAYGDVEDAFDEYMTSHNEGRDIVLIGHSQGAHMLQRLLARKIEGNDTLKSQFLVAMLIGPLQEFTVPMGEIVGGTLQEIPLCTANDERGCVIAYNTAREGYDPPAAWLGTDPAVNDRPCTNPADLSGASAPAAGVLFPTWWRRTEALPVAFDGISPDSGVVADFVLYRDYFNLGCATTTDGIHYLQITDDPAGGDVRVDPVDYTSAILAVSIGTHVLDYTWTVEDLKEQLRARLP